MDLGKEMLLTAEGQEVAEEVGGRSAGDALAGREVAAPGRLLHLEVFDRDALSAGKAEGGPGGLPLRVEGDLGRRADRELLAGGLLGGEVGDEGGEPTVAPHK